MTDPYLSLTTDDPKEEAADAFLRSSLQEFFQNFQQMVSQNEFAKIDAPIYSNLIIDPAGRAASITIAHTFYGVFEVVSLLTGRRTLLTMHHGQSTTN